MLRDGAAGSEPATNKISAAASKVEQALPRGGPALFISIAFFRGFLPVLANWYLPRVSSDTLSNSQFAVTAILSASGACWRQSANIRT
jgi:hypothetical protein